MDLSIQLSNYLFIGKFFYLCTNFSLTIFEASWPEATGLQEELSHRFCAQSFIYRDLHNYLPLYSQNKHIIKRRLGQFALFCKRMPLASWSNLFLSHLNLYCTTLCNNLYYSMSTFNSDYFKR